MKNEAPVAVSGVERQSDGERGRDETKGTCLVLRDALQMGLILLSCLSFSLIQICPCIFPSTFSASFPFTHQQPCSCSALSLPPQFPVPTETRRAVTELGVYGVLQAPSLLLHSQRESVPDCKCLNSNLWIWVFLCEWGVWKPLQGDGDPVKMSGSLL